MLKLRVKFSTVVVSAALVCFVGVRDALILLAAAALHEAGHIAAMYMTGRPPESVTVCAFGAVITRRHGISSYFADLAVYMAGCAANLICAGLFFGIAPDFARVSVALCVFNLMPLDGFDGCNALCSLLSVAFSPDVVDRIDNIVSSVILFTLWTAVIYVNIYNGRGLFMLAMCVYLSMPKIIAAAKTNDVSGFDKL